MHGRVWIAAMALVWGLGCESESEGDALQTPTPGNSGEPSLTRYCCDRSLTDCDPEPEKVCSEDDGKPVINWE